MGDKEEMNEEKTTEIENATVVAHQIKSPVGSLHTILQTLLGGFAGELTSQQKRMLQGADRRCEEALETIQGLLSLSRVRQRVAEGEKTADLVAIVHTLHERYSDAASTQEKEFIVEQKSDDAYVGMDRQLLTEALSALIDNAIKYTPQGGRIKVMQAISEKKNEIIIKISDSGIGIPRHEHSGLFKPFFRASNARKQVSSGTGLGLAFVKAVIDAADGSISAGKSSLGGAEFTISLPRRSAPVSSNGESVPEPSMRVVVIGGVAAGPKIAAKVKRLDPEAEVTIVEMGRILSYAGCGLPYYISGMVDDQKELVSTPEGVLRGLEYFQRVKDVRVLNRTEALQIDRKNRSVRIRGHLSGEEDSLPYDRLALATGAVPEVPGIQGVNLQNIFRLQGFEQAEGIKSHLSERRAKDVVIVGGGLIGVEMAESLVSAGSRVTLVEKESHILPTLLDFEMAGLVRRHFEAKGVRIASATAVQGFEGDGKVEKVVAETREFPADMVIMGTGVKPNIKLAEEAGLEIGPAGGIKTDLHMRTSDPDIYAAGDCVESNCLITGEPVYQPLGSTANKQGRVAAENICGGKQVFPGVVRTCICKVFDYTVARSGLTEAQANAAGFETVVSIAPGVDRSHFMPGAKMIIIKLVADAGSGRILGIQAVGPGEVAKRVDVAVAALTAGMTVDQVSNLDHCYAPSYSESLDNLHVAANVIKNKMAGRMTGISPSKVREKLNAGENITLLDVRTHGEFAGARIDGSRHIPISALRGRIDELPMDSEIILFSRVSLSAYEASIIIKANGFEKVKVMDGGITMWTATGPG